MIDPKVRGGIAMSNIRIQKISITDLATDAIVNAANEGLWAGTGVCGAIFLAAGHRLLKKACDDIGHCDVGSAVITPGFNLKARYVIHAVGPQWIDGKHREPRLLYSAYYESLKLATEYGCHSIGFPLISAGVFGYPLDGAWRKAIQACNDFIRKHPDYDIDIFFAVLDDRIIDVGEKTMRILISENAIKKEETRKESEDCFYRVFIAKPGDYLDSSKYTFVGDFGSFEYAQRFIGHMYHDDDFKNPDTIVMKIPAYPVCVKDGTFDAVISCMGEVLRMDWDEIDSCIEDKYFAMPETHSIRRVQIPIRQEQFEALSGNYYLVDKYNWIVFHHPGHFLIYDRSSKYCILDAAYEKLGQSEDTLEDDPLAAVVTSILLNQDKDQCPNLDEDDVFRILCDICYGERRHEMIPEQDKPVEVQSYILNLSFPTELDDVLHIKQEYPGLFDMEVLLYTDEVYNWTAPKWVKPGDIVFFMHSKTSILSIRRLKKELKQKSDQYTEEEYTIISDALQKGEEIYSKYGAKIFMFGRADESPVYLPNDQLDHSPYWKSRIYVNVCDCQLLANPIDLSEFSSFIKLSCGGSITPVFGDEFESLKALITARGNTIPNYLALSRAMPIPLAKINENNWIQISSQYRLSFIYESQFRAFYVDYLLKQLGDKKTIYRECPCKKGDLHPSYVDNVILFGGKYLPVEVKLSKDAETDLRGQLRKYCNVDVLYLDSKEGHIAENSRVISDKVLLIDTYGIYLFSYQDDTITDITDLADIKCDSDIQRIRGRILSALQ